MRLGVAIASLGISALLGQQRSLAEDSARIAGVVFTATQRDRAVIPGAHVKLTTADSVRETLTDASGAVYPGVVSADGNLLAAATLTGGGGQAPQMFVGFKQ